MTEQGRADDADKERGVVQDEIAGLRRRMDEIKAEVTEDLEKNWPSPWRGGDAVNAKVSARLSGHTDYQSLLADLRKAQAKEKKLPNS